MVSTNTARELAMAFAEAVEEPHFEKTSFRVKKKIFATMDENKNTMVLKLTEMEQSLFGAHNNSIVYPVPSAWGKQGYTVFELKKVRKTVLKDALQAAYCNTAPKKLADNYR